MPSTKLIKTINITLKNWQKLHAIKMKRNLHAIDDVIALLIEESKKQI